MASLPPSRPTMSVKYRKNMFWGNMTTRKDQSAGDVSKCKADALSQQILEARVAASKEIAFLRHEILARLNEGINRPSFDSAPVAPHDSTNPTTQLPPPPPPPANGIPGQFTAPIPTAPVDPPLPSSSSSSSSSNSRRLLEQLTSFPEETMDNFRRVQDELMKLNKLPKQHHQARRLVPSRSKINLRPRRKS
ncbi:hypothetical protein KSP40_PGU011291 [Platanthera guangdongensis]|uniref:Uncharacterized protein n=1 Tax=Platanthera guangdongensis TaxID=2320717 RepID=A0ABR2MGS2_9ASPA